ncbi:MAG: TIGR03016 family PEP-CTERM system-associated outer membrane protein [Pseudomonadota bacterium]
MTITTTEVGLRRRPIALAAALLALLAAPAARAEWKFTPTVELRETYTDNVALASDALAEGRFVTEISPGFALANNTRRFKLHAIYQLHYYAFDDKDVPDVKHAQNQFSANLRSVLVDDLLYFDASGSVGQQAVSAFGPAVNGNGYATANRANVKAWRMGPTLRHAFGASATGVLRYTHDQVDAGASGLGATRSDSLSATLASGPLFRKLGWDIAFSRQNMNDNRAPASSVKNAGLGLRYQVLQTLQFNVRGGYDEYDYQSIAGPSKGSFWQLGMGWEPSSRSSLRASFGKRYYGDSYSLEALHRSRGTVWTINYNDEVTTTRAQFLLPATIDTASMLDRLFRADFPDAEQRRLAVEAYMRATNLPAALAENVNYFTNRYLLQKRWQASVVLNSARSTAVLSLFDTRRDALSSSQTDGPITGPGNVSTNDNTRQRGVSALFNYRISSRSGVNLSLVTSKNLSETTGLETENKAARLSMTRTFSPRTRGEVELRRTSGAALANATYRENAVSASISMRF